MYTRPSQYKRPLQYTGSDEVVMILLLIWGGTNTFFCCWKSFPNVLNSRDACHGSFDASLSSWLWILLSALLVVVMVEVEIWGADIQWPSSRNEHNKTSNKHNQNVDWLIFAFILERN